MLCEEKNFQRDGLSDLTVILCDQCEREFHIGCLRKCKGIDLDHIPRRSATLYFVLETAAADAFS